MTEHANRALESKSLWHRVHLQSLPLSAAEPLPVLSDTILTVAYHGS